MTKKISAVLAAALLIPAAALAAELRAGEQPSLSASETINDDFYIAGGSVSSAGAVRGDLAAIGGSVLIRSSTSADAAAGGGNVTVLGAVGDDLRVGGGDVLVGGKVGGDVIAGGGQVQLTGDGIGGDVVWGGGALRVDAPVAGDMTLRGGDVFLDSTVGGNVNFKGERLTLGRNAAIQGNLTYSSPKEATLEEGAVVRGETAYTKAERRGVSKEAAAGIVSAFFIGKFLSVLILALLFGALFKRYANALVERVAQRPLLELGRGFVTLIVLPVASVLLFFTLLGIPLGLFGLLAFAALLVFVSIAAPIVLGSIVHQWVFKPQMREVTWKTTLLGVALYSVVRLVPIIGWLAAFALILMTLGAVVKMKWNIMQEWR